MQTLKDGGHYLIPICALIYFLGFLQYSASTAGLYALVCLFLVSFIRKESRLNLKKILEAIENSVKMLLVVTLMCAMVSILMTGINITGLGINIAGALVDFSKGNLFVLLILSALCCYIFGMDLPIVPSYILLSLLVAPAIVRLGVEPIVAHLFIVYYALSSMITPPVCPAAFVAATIAKAPMMKTGFTSMRLGIILLIIPFMFVYNPSLLFIGPGIDIAVSVVMAITGTVMLSAAICKYFLRNTGFIERIMLFIGGILAILPGAVTNIIGIIILSLVIFYELSRIRKAKLLSVHNTQIAAFD